MSEKQMKLIDPNTGLMECKTCGSRHVANIRPNSGGKFYRGVWQCKNDRCPTPRSSYARISSEAVSRVGTAQK